MAFLHLDAGEGDLVPAESCKNLPPASLHPGVQPIPSLASTGQSPYSY